MNKQEATAQITDYYFWRKKPTLKQVKECIEAGADLSELVNTNTVGDPYTIMAMAAMKCPDALEDLVKAGANVNQQDYNNQTAIDIAAEYSSVSPKTLQKLIDLGADKSGLVYAYDRCLYGNSDSFSIDGLKKLEILINNGVDPNRASSRDGLPLLIIAKQALKSYNQKINKTVGATTIKDKDVFAFMEVARGLEFLIKNGADIYKRGKWYNEEGERVEESFYSVTAPYIPFVIEMADFLSTHKKEDISEFIEERLKKDEKYLVRRLAEPSKTLKKDMAKDREDLAMDLRKILYDSSVKKHLKRLEKAKDKAAEYHIRKEYDIPMRDPSHPEFYKKNVIQTALKFKVKDK